MLGAGPVVANIAAASGAPVSAGGRDGNECRQKTRQDHERSDRLTKAKGTFVPLTPRQKVNQLEADDRECSNTSTTSGVVTTTRPVTTTKPVTTTTASTTTKATTTTAATTTVATTTKPATTTTAAPAAVLGVTETLTGMKKGSPFSLVLNVTNTGNAPSSVSVKIDLSSTAALPGFLYPSSPGTFACTPAEDNSRGLTSTFTCTGTLSAGASNAVTISSGSMIIANVGTSMTAKVTLNPGALVATATALVS